MGREMEPSQLCLDLQSPRVEYSNPIQEPKKPDPIDIIPTQEELSKNGEGFIKFNYPHTGRIQLCPN